MCYFQLPLPFLFICLLWVPVSSIGSSCFRDVYLLMRVSRLCSNDFCLLSYSQCSLFTAIFQGHKMLTAISGSLMKCVCVCVCVFFKRGVQLQLQNQLLSWALRDGWMEEEEEEAPPLPVCSEVTQVVHKWSRRRFTGSRRRPGTISKAINGEGVQRQRKMQLMCFHQSAEKTCNISSDMQIKDANCAIFSCLHLPYFEWLISTAGYGDVW